MIDFIFMPISAVLAIAALATLPAFVSPSIPSVKIVGGDESLPGQFPYYVKFGCCGGALIAPDIVLSAAHCILAPKPCDVTIETDIYIGAMKRNSTEDGAQIRKCNKWIRHSNYSFLIGKDNLALCKLNQRIDIDESFVTLELNQNNSFPINRSETIVMGMGGTLLEPGTYLEFPQNYSDVLQNTTVKVISTKECKDIYEVVEIPFEILCLRGDFIDGEVRRDTCKGDSGGPVVVRTTQGNGAFKDIHVGTVSAGYGCGLDPVPGLNVRTSSSYEWIFNTTCFDLLSVAEWCPSPQPSAIPSEPPSISPQPTISVYPSESPSETPSTSQAPSDVPSDQPTISVYPSESPSETPSTSQAPSEVPSDQPTISAEPTISPSVVPSNPPSSSAPPSIQPSEVPSDQPTISVEPSESPSESPSISQAPSDVPSDQPTISVEPSESPSDYPSNPPTSSAPPSISVEPSESPSETPSTSQAPSDVPSEQPTISVEPSNPPTSSAPPSISVEPSESPSETPSISQPPSDVPSDQPTISQFPTLYPSNPPTTMTPTIPPTRNPTISPTPGSKGKSKSKSKSNSSSKGSKSKNGKSKSPTKGSKSTKDPTPIDVPGPTESPLGTKSQGKSIKSIKKNKAKKKKKKKKNNNNKKGIEDETDDGGTDEESENEQETDSEEEEASWLILRKLERAYNARNSFFRALDRND